MEILHEDNHLLIVSKPAGLLTQPGGKDRDSLEKQGKRYIKEKYQKPGLVFLEAAHRLDKASSGIVVFARTGKALKRLHEAIRRGEWKKRYLALIEGVLPEDHGVLEDYLVHGDHRAEIADAASPNAKHARLKYRYIGKRCIEIDLETGRYHQIRVQLSSRGCPIVGDVKYGSIKAFPNQGIALHHASLEFIHPVTGKKIVKKSLIDYDDKLWEQYLHSY